MRRFITTELKRRAIDKLWRQYAAAVVRFNSEKDANEKGAREAEELRARIEDNIVRAHEGEDLNVNA